jgi:hypothetical protein
MMINVKLTQGQTPCEVLSAKTILSPAQPIVGCGWRYSSREIWMFQEKGLSLQAIIEHTFMNTMTLSPTSPVSLKYWSELKDLSNSVKLELITLLSSSVANSVSEPSNEKGWTKSFAGRWQDDRTAEEIIEDIRTSRNANIKEVSL